MKTKTYCIRVKYQNVYIAQRFDGDNILSSGLTLKEAYKKLLDLYNEKYEGERPFAPNWNIAVCQSKKHVFGALPTYKDGTRAFEWDSRTYIIEEEN